MSRRTRLEVTRLEDRDVPATLIAGITAVGSGPGVESRVDVLDSQNGALKYSIDPFPGFTGGVTVASGDVNGDGTPDVIVGAGPGGGPQVAVFDGKDGSPIASFFAFEDTFTGGVNVAAGDFNADGRADVVVGTGVGGGPRVRIFSGNGFGTLKDALVYEPTFRGGVNVAVGDVNGDGTPDIATSTGQGGGPRVVVFNGKTLTQLASFFAFDATDRNGFNIGVGDVNADGRADIVAGSGAGDPAEVRVFSGKNLSRMADFFIGNTPNTLGLIPYISGDAGVRVAVADVNGDLIGDVVTAKGPGSTPILRSYQITAVNLTTNALFPSLQQIRSQTVFDPSYGAGLSLGTSDNTGNPLS